MWVLKCLVIRPFPTLRRHCNNLRFHDKILPQDTRIQVSARRQSEFLDCFSATLQKSALFSLVRQKLTYKKLAHDNLKNYSIVQGVGMRRKMQDPQKLQQPWPDHKCRCPESWQGGCPPKNRKSLIVKSILCLLIIPLYAQAGTC